MHAAPLGDFELLVLLAVLHAGEDANGSAVLRELRHRSGRKVARGQRGQKPV